MQSWTRLKPFNFQPASHYRTGLRQLKLSSVAAAVVLCKLAMLLTKCNVLRLLLAGDARPHPYKGRFSTRGWLRGSVRELAGNKRLLSYLPPFAQASALQLTHPLLGCLPPTFVGGYVMPYPLLI